MTFDTILTVPTHFFLPKWAAEGLSLPATLWLRWWMRFRILAPRDVSLGCILVEAALAVWTLNVIGIDGNRRRGKVRQTAPLTLDLGNFFGILEGVNKVLVFGSPVQLLQ